MKKLILSAGFLLASLASMAQACPEPFFSEYIEGSSNNKAIEIYNPSNAPLDLENYMVQIFANGVVVPTNTLIPIGIVEPHGVFVIANGAANATILGLKDTTSSVANYNGDDALILVNLISGDTVDVIGVVGVDPGASWPVGAGSTVNQTLTRQFAITAGVSDWAIGATQWNVHPIDMVDSLGFHTAEMIPPTIVADWSSSADELTVNFTDASTGLVSTYLWDFGDGETSDEMNPEHVYASNGEYTVCLIAGGCDLPDTLCMTITVCEVVVAAYTSDISALTATFTNESLGGVVSYAWDFGDGSTSTMESPSHTYAEAGEYTVCFIAASDCDADTICTTVTITCDLPVANFSTDPDGLDINFVNEALFGVDYDWDFGDGATDTDDDPTHVYAENGTYLVCLTVSNECGSVEFCDSITVCDIIAADFSSTQSAFDVDFTNASTGTIDAYSWDFGDGASSTDENPTHTYAEDGDYTVCLIVTNECLEMDTLCETITINTASLAENGLASISVYPNPFTAEFSLNLGSDFDQVNVIITDLNGRVIAQTNAVQNGVLTFDLAVDAGVYLVQITAGTETKTVKVIKK